MADFLLFLLALAVLLVPLGVMALIIFKKDQR